MTDIEYGVRWRDRGPFWRRGTEHTETVTDPCPLDHDHAAFAARAMVILGRRRVRVVRRAPGGVWVVARRFGVLDVIDARLSWKRAAGDA